MLVEDVFDFVEPSLILFDFVFFSSGAFEVLVPMLLKHRQLLQSKSFVSNYLVIKKELGYVGPWTFEERKTVILFLEVRSLNKT